MISLRSPNCSVDRSGTGACRWARATTLHPPRPSHAPAPVLGLFALPPDPTCHEHVVSISVPLLFLFRYNDELMTRAAGLASWNAFGSKEKTVHINPGCHVGLPAFESGCSLGLFTRKGG